MGQQQLDSLTRDGRYISVPKGISMRPMIVQGRDAVLVEAIKDKPKRYDLVMYTRGEENGVIHRVIHRYDDHYIICGDNCWRLEYVRPEQIKGIVTRFNRKGKWHEINELPYQLYVHLWVDLIDITRPLFYLRDKVKSIKKKLSSLSNKK